MGRTEIIFLRSIMKLAFLLLFPLILVACPSQPPIPTLAPGQLGETATLTGTADKWIGSAKTIKLEVLKAVTRAPEYLEMGTIDAAGNFSISLPGTAAMNPYLENSKAAYASVNCPTLKVNPSDVRGSYIVNIAVFDGTTKIGLLSLKPDQSIAVGDIYAALLFTDKTADFDVVCTQGGYTNHVHSRVEKGWYYDLNELYTANLGHEYIDTLPANIKWTYSSTL
jgi:hypothetical protein